MAGLPPAPPAPLLQLRPLQIPPLQVPEQPQGMVVRVMHPPNPHNHQQSERRLMDSINFKVLADMQGRSTCVTLLQINGPRITLPDEFVNSVACVTQNLPAQELILKHHKLNTLPENFAQVGSISILDLSFNSFEVVPDVLGDLTHLKQLYLQHNQVASLPASLGRLAHLKVITLQHNKLCELPAGVCNCVSLEVLNIEGNKIKAFSDNIDKLVNLKQLHASCNAIESLPTSLCNLSNLEELYLSNNGIRTINEISNMRSLKQLHLANNKLQFLPACIANMHQLEGLTLTGNPMRFPPLSACRRGIRCMQQYMADKIASSVVDYGQGDFLITNIYYTGSDYELENGNESPYENID